MNTLNSHITRLLGLIFILASANATAIISNPDPTSWADDAGVETFAPGVVAASIELYDPFDSFSAFGFYFVGTDVTDVNNLTVIFDQLDQGGPGQSALIDFTSGDVFDADASVLQDTFTAGFGDVGFFLHIDGTSLFTEAALNPFGLDLSGTFTSLGDSTSHLLSFEAPDGTPVGFDLILGFTANANVPEPSTFVLILLTLPMIGFVASRRRV